MHLARREARDPMSIQRAVILAGAALAAVAGATTISAPAARAGGYTCVIPRALLCEGCASQVAITLVRGGTCRVSFTPGATEGAPSGATAFSFYVQTPAVAAAAAPRPAAARPPAATAAPNSKCFVFNDNRYCE